LLGKTEGFVVQIIWEACLDIRILFKLNWHDNNLVLRRWLYGAIKIVRITYCRIDLWPNLWFVEWHFLRVTFFWQIMIWSIFIAPIVHFYQSHYTDYYCLTKSKRGILTLFNRLIYSLIENFNLVLFFNRTPLDTGHIPCISNVK